MGMLSVRLPDDIETRLDEEARLSHRKRAEIIREAVVLHLRKLERERVLGEMVKEIKQLDLEQERAENEQWLEPDNEAMELSLGPEPEEKWWR